MAQRGVSVEGMHRIAGLVLFVGLCCTQQRRPHRGFVLSQGYADCGEDEPTVR